MRNSSLNSACVAGARAGFPGAPDQNHRDSLRPGPAYAGFRPCQGCAPVATKGRNLSTNLWLRTPTLNQYFRLRPRCFFGGANRLPPSVRYRGVRILRSQACTSFMSSRSGHMPIAGQSSRLLRLPGWEGEDLALAGFFIGMTPRPGISAYRVILTSPERTVFRSQRVKGGGIPGARTGLGEAA
jgi:hypothetical protein